MLEAGAIRSKNAMNILLQTVLDGAARWARGRGRRGGEGAGAGGLGLGWGQPCGVQARVVSIQHTHINVPLRLLRSSPSHSAFRPLTPNHHEPTLLIQRCDVVPGGVRLCIRHWRQPQRLCEWGLVGPG